MTDKRKLLILIDWFTPGYKAGGPIQSCANLCWGLKDIFDIYVLTTDTDHGDSEPYPGIKSNVWQIHPELGVHVYYARKAGLTTRQLKEVMMTLSPDSIYLNHLFSPLFVVYPLWLKLRGKLQPNMVVCPRGALYDSALSLKSYKKKPLLLLYKWLGINKKVRFHATNEREKAAILQYFPGSEIRIADNLPNLRQPPFQSVEKSAGTVRCIFIARIVAIKNLKYILEVLKRVRSKVEFTVIGPIEDEAYWEDCKNLISRLPPHIRVEFQGPQKNESLMEHLMANHLFILPTTGENFGHAIFESFLAGRPVLISDQTPWLNLVRENAGWDVPLDKPGLFESTIEKVADFDQTQYNTWAEGAWKYANHFINNPVLLKQYKDLFL